ncbi:glycine betaine/L-proline ABC transporter ATP-binding protein [Fodinisporobacter ferrooxydans]|uniref:Quaternary amine transport ATP-binding protein n=1 Tax=Fodinisporobacter ferrooxydans TaxID=2901836 RepID=A0ABY4CNT0_9BACL|nr:glycine betaine/L-proline ABC transporter ATP-binding protein [Alicyclobacillaceae bacterium MYW30-H2]
MEPIITIRNVSKLFGSRQDEAIRLLESGASKDQILQKCGVTIALNHVNLNIQPGELFVIMGLSGSGKSTLLRCLNRLIDPSLGAIVIDGQNIVDMGKNELQRFRQKKMAMVFQKFALFPHRTVLENVAFGLEIQNVDKEQRLQVAREKLAAVGLEGWEEQYPQNLSGGMQQRVGLARALCSDPDILLMDEAFSALDPLIRDDMQSELLQLQQKLKKTIVFITHDLNEALRIGDRIALMKDGAVVQVGTPEEIITNPADEYVSRFVKGVDVTKVLVAKDVMKRPSPVLRLKEGPNVALRVLRDAGLSSGFVVDQERRLQGLIMADAVARAAANKVQSLAECPLEQTIQVAPDTSLEELVNLIVTTRYPLAVVDQHAVLQGLILKSSILEAIAEQGGREER